MNLYASKRGKQIKENAHKPKFRANFTVERRSFCRPPLYASPKKNNVQNERRFLFLSSHDIYIMNELNKTYSKKEYYTQR